MRIAMLPLTKSNNRRGDIFSKRARIHQTEIRKLLTTTSLHSIAFTQDIVQLFLKVTWYV